MAMGSTVEGTVMRMLLRKALPKPSELMTLT